MHDKSFWITTGFTALFEIKMWIAGGKNRSLYSRWERNRFNIYFVNAGLLYMYDALIMEFQTKVIKPRNNLHHVVYNIISTGKLQPLLRALGLVYKFVAGPWMD